MTLRSNIRKYLMQASKFLILNLINCTRGSILARCISIDSFVKFPFYVVSQLAVNWGKQNRVQRRFFDGCNDGPEVIRMHVINSGGVG